MIAPCEAMHLEQPDDGLKEFCRERLLLEEVHDHQQLDMAI
jgi:hypothetical protein